MTAKVFLIGPNKCGTRSLHHWFEKSGYRCIHWDRGRLASVMRSNREEGRPLLDGYEDHVLYSDMENIHDMRGMTYAYEWFEDLHRQYPGSKFILNVRPIEHWIRSRLNHVTYLIDTMAALGVDEDEAVLSWREHFQSQVRRARVYFASFPEAFREFDIESESVEKLLPLLKDWKLDAADFEHVAKTKPDKKMKRSA